MRTMKKEREEVFVEGKLNSAFHSRSILSTLEIPGLRRRKRTEKKKKEGFWRREIFSPKLRRRMKKEKEECLKKKKVQLS